MAPRVTIPYTGPDQFGQLAYPGDVGIDLPIAADITIPPGARVDVGTGIKLAIPDGYYGRIVGRSSALRKRGLRVYEGIIDSGFRGELYSYIENTSSFLDVNLQAGERVAQLIIAPVINTEFLPYHILPESERGTNGFGSSDVPPDVKDDPGVVRPMVYAGGPIDGTAIEARQWHGMVAGLLTRAGVGVFDPYVYWQGKIALADSLMEYNTQRLMSADGALFYLDPALPFGHWGVGTPIEMFMFATTGRPMVVYAPTGWETSLYFKAIIDSNPNAEVIDDPKDAVELLAARTLRHFHQSR